MSESSDPPAGRPSDLLGRLQHQLHLLIPTLMVAGGTPETATMIAGLRETTSRLEPLLRSVDPVILTAIREGLRHAVAGEHDATRSELLSAYHRLAVLTHREQRRDGARYEQTARWSPDTTRHPLEPGTAAD